MKNIKANILRLIKLNKKKTGPQAIFLAAVIVLFLSYQVRADRTVPVSLIPEFDIASGQNMVITVGGNFNPRAQGGEYPLFCLCIGNFFHVSDLNILSLAAPHADDDMQSLQKPRPPATSAEEISLLKTSGIGLLQLSGSHILDYGAPGLVHTLGKLGELEIAHIGAGLNKADAFSPYYLTKGSLTAGILALNSFPPQEMAAGQNRLGVAAGNAEELAEVLKEMTKQSDIIIVMVSFPPVSAPGATDSQKTFGRSLIDLGAHIVVGSGGDIVQETEIYRQGTIFYNLGNISAPRSGFGYAQEAVLLQFSFSPGGTSEVRTLPVQSTGPTALTPAKGFTGSLLRYKIFKRLQGNSPWQKHKSFYSLELPAFYQ